MPKVKLISISCESTSTNSFDQPHLVIDGRKIWSTEEMDSGDVLPLNLILPIMLQDRAVIKLFDHDCLELDEALDTLIIEEEKIRFNENLSSVFAREKAHYTLTYCIEN